VTTLADVCLQMQQLLPDAPPGPAELRVDGRRHYFGRKKKSWYRLHENIMRNGRAVIRGGFGNFRSPANGGGTYRVEVDYRSISEEERRQLQLQRQAAAAAEQAQRARSREEAALTAAELWRRASPTGASPYLQRKGVQGEACRYLPDGSLLVPLVRYDLPREQALQALQRIWPRKRIDERTGDELGDKTYTRGFSKARAACRLGMAVVDEPILVCEGYATGLSLRMALERRLPVFVALDAGNLRHVCEMLRELYPRHRLLICADDDWQTPGNPGRAAAAQAAAALGRIDIVWPVFARVARQPGDTDFNDLHLRAGLGAVRRQLCSVLAAMRRYRNAA
jgi:putative DNA primase/helicase